MRMWTLTFLIIAAGVSTIKGCSAEHCSSIIKDCDDYWLLKHRTSGVYRVIPNGMTRGFDVYCEMTAEGGWLVFQRRLNGSVDFEREWTDYEVGFGDIEHEFWLGLLPLKRILSNAPGNYELRIDLEDWDGEKRYAQYSLFDIGGPEDNYKLYVYGYTGNAGDDMGGSSGRNFTTVDRDNDRSPAVNCAEFRKGAWWYDICMNDANLNGFYHTQNPLVNWNGITWMRWKGNNHSLKSTEMKMKRV